MFAVDCLLSNTVSFNHPNNLTYAAPYSELHNALARSCCQNSLHVKRRSTVFQSNQGRYRVLHEVSTGVSHVRDSWMTAVGNKQGAAVTAQISLSNIWRAEGKLSLAASRVLSAA